MSEMIDLTDLSTTWDKDRKRCGNCRYWETERMYRSFGIKLAPCYLDKLNRGGDHEACEKHKGFPVTKEDIQV